MIDETLDIISDTASVAAGIGVAQALIIGPFSLGLLIISITVIILSIMLVSCKEYK